MSKTIASAVALAALLGSSAVFAGERTVTLNVRNMYCDLCPHTVKASLEAVPGAEGLSAAVGRFGAVGLTVHAAGLL